MNVRLTQLDGKLPNMALMKLSAWHRARGDDVVFSRSPYRDMLEPEYGAVYASAIFSFSADRVERFRREFPEAIVGGTGTLSNRTVEDITGADFDGRDYSAYPDFTGSIGMTQTGCRLKCKFCVVPTKEGPNRSARTIADIWRGPPHPKHLHLLDNDFFGQPEAAWRARIDEIREGDFRVCFNQGLNVRLITPESAAALATVKYYDDTFTHRRLYTAWDNLKDEGVFFRGVDTLEAAGIPPYRLMAYMLTGFDKHETLDRILYRLERMTARGIEPYPMVYRDGPIPGDPKGRRYRQFQRWAIRRLYRNVPWADYDPGATGPGVKKSTVPLLEHVA